MNDLRKAAEMALKYFEDAHGLEDTEVAIKEALREALAEPANSTTNLVESKASSQTEQEHLGGEWVPCVKLPVIVHVRNQRNGETHISTREGITPVLPDDLIMRGVAGEEYPIGRELFERTYTFDVDNVDISGERVQKTDKSIHEPVAWMKPSGLVSPYKHGSYQIPLYTAPPISDYHEGWEEGFKTAKREWVGYTNEDRERIVPMLVQSLINHDKKTMAGLLNAILIDIDQQLKEKNT